MVAELTRINQWLTSRLRGDPELQVLVGGRVYSDLAPQGAAMPIVVYAFLGGADKLLGSRARTSNAIYLIRAIANGSSYEPLEPIADRIEHALAIPDTGLLIRDVLLVGTAREQPFQRKDAEMGINTVYLGGFYRIRFQPPPEP